jgi:hypothetical protein
VIVAAETLGPAADEVDVEVVVTDATLTALWELTKTVRTVE